MKHYPVYLLILLYLKSWLDSKVQFGQIAMTNKRVLLIDDNEDTRTMVKFALEMNAVWKVLTAGSAIEGIALAETERPDIALLNLAMPQLDGLTTYDILKANLFTCSIPIVFITAHTQEKVIS